MNTTKMITDNSYKHFFSNLFKVKHLRDIFIACAVSTLVLPICISFYIYEVSANTLYSYAKTESERIAYFLARDAMKFDNKDVIWSLLKHINSHPTLLTDLELYKLKIFDLNGKIIFSSELSEIWKINEGDYFKSITKWQRYSEYVHKLDKNAEWEKVSRSIIETYMPMVRWSDFLGAIEIYYDITKNYNVIKNSSWTTFLFLLALSGSFLISMVVVLHASLGSVFKRRAHNQAILEHKMKLLNLARIKNNLMQLIVHEIRTPITIVRSYVEVLLGPKVQIRQRQNYLKKIETRCSELLDLVNNTLDSNKLDIHMLKYHKKMFDVWVVLKELIEDFGRLYPEKNLNLVFRNMVKEGLQISSDEAKFKRILVNLLSNAYKFSPDNRDVIVSLERDKNMIMISIEDFGVWIAKKNLTKIFNKFEQIKSPLNSGHASSWLGLYLVKTLLKWLWGSIDVNSSLGKWSTFIVRLPV